MFKKLAFEGTIIDNYTSHSTNWITIRIDSNLTELSKTLENSVTDAYQLNENTFLIHQYFSDRDTLNSFLSQPIPKNTKVHKSKNLNWIEIGANKLILK